MAQHARTLAARHRIEHRSARERLLPRLRDNARVIGQASASLKAGRDITPASQALLESTQLIEEQVRLAGRGLSRKAIRHLPHLAGATGHTEPRVYRIALELVAHSDCQVDAEALSHFLAAYQETTALSLGELEAVPTMLRLALVEKVRDVAAANASGVVERGLARQWADRMVASPGDPASMILAVADMERSAPPMTPAFVAGLVRGLQGHNAALAMQWLGSRLAAAGLTVDGMVRAAIARQVADHTAVSAAIRSFRALGSIDWPEFVATHSVVEQALRLDPDGTYVRMDPATREIYRRKVGALARRANQAEIEVAQAALALARELRAPAAGGLDPRTRHVGHYLLGEGGTLLEQRLHIKPRSAMRLPGRSRVAAFIVAVVTFTVLFTAAALDRASDSALDEMLAAAFTLVFAIAASELAVALVHFISTQLTKPGALPRLDFRNGVPDDAQALVVLPCVLHTAATVDALCETMEVRFLANRDPNLCFCLLADFPDADAQHGPGDDVLLQRARAKIDALNRRYASDRVVAEVDEEGNAIARTHRLHPFVLLHRARRWNPREGIWMGYERKRGQLAELFAFLRGGARGSVDLAAGELPRPHEVRYVITLDADTLLPRDAARKLVATMAHPLNQAQVAADGSRVVAGYGVLQPRVAIAQPQVPASRYEELCGGAPGADPYDRSGTDVYQDLFAEGSFAGKGIYDVDVAMRVLDKRFPENTVLSHELLEGCYLRAGMLSDQQLFEGCRARYNADVSRHHRKVRGDWQIAGWLRPTVPNGDGTRAPNPLTPLSRWKLFDNLRRSLVPPAFTALLVMSWPVIPVDWFWTAAVLVAMFLPPLLSALFNLVEKPQGALWPQHWSNVWHGAAMSLGHAALRLVFLPYEAFVNIDAILRTGWRMLVSRRRLLEWEPSSLSRSSTNLPSNARNMWFAPMLAVVCAVTLQLSNPAALLLAGPFLLAWLLSPLVAWWVSLPLPRPAAELRPADARALHKLARLTWNDFETLVNAEGNWLAPDNMQHPPAQEVAHRASPTSIGVSLLSNLAAWDFGYIPTGQMAARCAGTLATMARLERYRGHLFQCYDTLTLEALPPRRVSTVDSGNLAGYLLTLAAGLEQAGDAPLIGARTFDAIALTLAIIEDEAGDAPTSVRDAIAAMREELRRGGARAGGHTLPGVADRMAQLCRLAEALAAAAAAAASETELGGWCERLRAQCDGIMAELDAMAPWAARADQYVLDSRLTRMPTLRELAALELPGRADPGDERSASLVRLLEDGKDRAEDRLARLEALAHEARAGAWMDFAFLYDENTGRLSTGFNVAELRMEAGAHEQLATEARLASYVAIAQGQLPGQHWLSLGRQLCYVNHEQVLQPGSGALSEYLMPLLVMPSYRGTLLDQSCRAVVRARAAARRGQPAPATTGESILGLMVNPDLAMRSLRRRVPGDRRVVTPHGQGVALLALDYLLSGQPMQRRFASDPGLRATLLVLQERAPKSGAFRVAHAEADAAPGPAQDSGPAAQRQVSRPVTPTPEVQLLSNGRYHVMISSAGGGYSRWLETDVTRWREDGTRDSRGSFCYVRDADTGAVWSATYQPALVQPDSYDAVFCESHVEIRRHDNGIDLETRLAVSPQDDIELRRTRVTNHSSERHTLELTSYAEVVLAPRGEDSMLAGFHAEILPIERAILCRRQAGEADTQGPYLLHMAAVREHADAGVSFETSRAAFVGDGNDAALPVAMRASGPLDGSGGAVPDPVAAIRCRLVLEPGQSTMVDYLTGMASDRDAALQLVRKYHDRKLADRVFDQACTESKVVLRQLAIDDNLAQVFATLAAGVLYPHAAMRAEPAALLRNQRGQAGLLAYGVTGDVPIMLLLVRGQEGLELARQVLQAHAYWRLKGLRLDLVIWCEDKEGQALRAHLIGMAASGIDAPALDRPGGVSVRALDQVPPDDQLLMRAAARVVIDSADGPLAAQVAQASIPVHRYGPIAPEPDSDRSPYPLAPLAMPDLQLSLGPGGFTTAGREYVVRNSAGTCAAAQWSNVLANPSFGSIVSGSGDAFTWSEDAHKSCLTPRHDRASGDASGEAFYIRDEQSGRFWSPAALPATGSGDYITRHGFGYSVFEHAQDAIHSEMTTFVAPDAVLKYTVIRVRNDSDTLRRLSVSGYVEWVLGERREKTAMHIVTELDEASGALFARNAFSPEFGGRVGFFHVNAQIRTVTGDRTEFIGRTRSLARPAALRRRRLSGRVGAALDPCAAFCAPFALRPGEERELVFVLGVGGRRSADGTHLIETCGSGDAARRALDKVRDYWEQLLGAVQVRTPDPALDVMVNGWLVYRALAGNMEAGASFGNEDGGPVSWLADVLTELAQGQGQGGSPQSTLAGILAAKTHAGAGEPERAWQLVRQLMPAAFEAGAGTASRAHAEPCAPAAMYLLIVESLLGLRLRDGDLTLAPLLPAGWDGFTAHYRHGTSLYLIEVRRADGPSLSLDGVPVDAASITLDDDGAEHRIDVRIGPA